MGRLSLRALLLWTGLAAGVAGAILALSQSWNADEASPLTVQELVLPDLDGRHWAIGHWRDKTLLVNFWATWCAPCREEIPLLREAQAKYADRLQVIGIAIDDSAEVAAYQKQFRIGYPVLLGDFGTLSVTARQGNTGQVLPFTLILSPRGEVLAVKVGSYREPELETLLERLLTGSSKGR